jgi:hypothetical protein
VFGVPLLELLVSEKKRKLGIPYIVFATTNHLLTHGTLVLLPNAPSRTSHHHPPPTTTHL